MYRLGLDVGGTKINIGIIRYDGKKACVAALRTLEVKKVECVLSEIKDAAEGLCAEAGIMLSDIECCGVGIPGTVSRDGRRILKVPNIAILTEDFADRLAEYGIPVNEVRPGIIATDMTSKVKEKYDNLIGGGLLPIARWGEPEDIADAVFALCSGTLPYVTGQSLDVDGGFHMRRL